PDGVESVRSDSQQGHEIVLCRLETTCVEKMAAPSAERPLMARVELQGLVVLLDRPRVVALRPTPPGAVEIYLRGAHAVCDRGIRIRKRAFVILERGAHA